MYQELISDLQSNVAQQNIGPDILASSSYDEDELDYDVGTAIDEVEEDEIEDDTMDDFGDDFNDDED